MHKWFFIAAIFCGGATASPAVDSISILTYNAKGNGSTDWSTNSPQVQAIGREVAYLNPDVITFQEIPFTNTWQMPNFVKAYLPGYSLATNSGTDGFIRSVIASRFPIQRSTRWMSRSNLVTFGYDGPFTRDLFEAVIAVPGFTQPLHVFTTHLKAGTDSTSITRRAAESAAISNFLVTVFLPTNLAPYVLTGDMNEDHVRSAGAQAITILTSTPTGLHLTKPLNPITGSELTLSIQSSLFVRYDYILPGTLLFSNMTSSQVFRTDVLNSLPAGLLPDDDSTASDHLPVLMVFTNPYAKQFSITSVTRSNQTLTLNWNSVPGQVYRVEASTNLLSWSAIASNLLATDYVFQFKTNVPGATDFFRVRQGF